MAIDDGLCWWCCPCEGVDCEHPKSRCTDCEEDIATSFDELDDDPDEDDE